MGQFSPELSIIIVSYNTSDLTIACLESVINETLEVSYEIIVVDNDSKDNSVTLIREKFPEVKLYALNENLGFARANNFAATKAHGNYLLLLNPDTVVLEKAIDKLYLFAIKNPQNHVYGGRTLYGDLTLNPTSCWKQPTVWSMFCYAIGLTAIFPKSSFFNPESYGKWERNSVKNVDIVTGCFLMIDKNFWGELGGFDEKFFMYGEDADLCLRAKKKGARPIITPDATIVHYCGASEKVRADKMIRLFKAKAQLMNTHWTRYRAKVGCMLLKYSSLTRLIAFELLFFFKTKKDNVWKNIWSRRNEW